MDEEEIDLPSDEEVARIAQEGFARSLAASGDTSGMVDVTDPKELIQDADQPDFAYINTYRVDDEGRQKRFRVEFNEVDDPAVGLAYMHAITSKDTDAKARQGLERKLWKVCIHTPEVLHTFPFYRALKAQARSEITNHCLMRLGVVNRRWAGIDPSAYVPAAPRVNQKPAAPKQPPVEDVEPQPEIASSASGVGSAPMKEISTPSATSSTSPAGTDSGPQTFSYGGPPRRSKPPGSPATKKP